MNATSAQGSKGHHRLFLGVGLLLLLLLTQARFRLALVVGESMLPGLSTGDLLLVDKRAYRSGEPRRGDIVLAPYGSELIVKRVVGLPGEEIGLQQGRIVVNGSVLAEGHAVQEGDLDISPGRLLEGKFALLGDNRRVAASQKVHAVVSRDQILGKVVWTVRLSKPLWIFIGRG